MHSRTVDYDILHELMYTHVMKYTLSMLNISFEDCETYQEVEDRLEFYGLVSWYQISERNFLGEFYPPRYLDSYNTFYEKFPLEKIDIKTEELLLGHVPPMGLPFDINEIELFYFAIGKNEQEKILIHKMHHNKFYKAYHCVILEEKAFAEFARGNISIQQVFKKHGKGSYLIIDVINEQLMRQGIIREIRIMPLEDSEDHFSNHIKEKFLPFPEIFVNLKDYVSTSEELVLANKIEEDLFDLISRGVSESNVDDIDYIEVNVCEFAYRGFKEKLDKPQGYSKFEYNDRTRDGGYYIEVIYNSLKRLMIKLRLDSYLSKGRSSVNIHYKRKV